MFGELRARKSSRARFLALTLFASSVFICALAASGPGGQAAAEKPEKKIDVFQVLIVNEDGSEKGVDKAWRLAGVVIDRSRKVKRNQTTAEVKVMDKMPMGKNMGKSYDVVFLVRKEAISKGKILTATSDSVGSCRAFMKTFLTKTLSSKRIAKAYKGAKLATVAKDPAAKSLAEKLSKDGWLRKC